MVRIVPVARVIAALAFSTALAGGAAAANAQPCQIHLADGQVAPCPPAVVSNAPGDPGGGNEPGSEPAEIAHEPLELSFLEPEEEPTKEEVVDESEDKNDEGVEPGQGD